MSFLKCAPLVFVIENRYEILIHTKKPGIISVIIGNKKYWEENSGVLYTEKKFAKISVPQKQLDFHKKYTISFCETIERKIHFSEILSEQTHEFIFKPIEKTENINLYYLSDIHYDFDLAIKAANYYGKDLDLLIVNGDLGEYNSKNFYLKVSKFLAKITKGIIPIIFSRGNHDTRGKYVELYTDYFPNINKKIFYKFSIGPIEGVVLDLGEDKLDSHPEYGNTNNFHDYRRKELQFIKNLTSLKKKYKIAISHICSPIYTIKSDKIFHIEHDLHKKICSNLERIGIDFILSGHFHQPYFIEPFSEQTIHKVNFPIIVGSIKDENYVAGAALTLNTDNIIIKITDHKKTIVTEKTLKKNN